MPCRKPSKKNNRKTQSELVDSNTGGASAGWANSNSEWAGASSGLATSHTAENSNSGWDVSGPNWVSLYKSEWEDIPDAEECAQRLGAHKEEEKSPEKIAQEKIKKQQREIDEKLKDWPWKNAPEQLITLGPYLPNLYHRDPWSLPKVEQTSRLFDLLGIDLIRRKILGWVMRDHFDGANFAMTCRSTFSYVATEIGFWDISDGWFNNCERPRYGPGSSDKHTLQGSVQSVLLITPVRHPKKARATGHPSGLYSRQMSNVKTMLRALHNFADFLDTVQFHRIPFLTTDLLNLVVPHMRNLKVLGVYKCQLIHLGDTLKLLDIIKEDRPLGKEDQVYLDIFPNYHLGPRSVPGCNDWSTGSYGVLWDNWGADTRLAIWALVSRILPRAFAQGIDLTKPGTAFRKWLEMSPCWRVEGTLEAMMDPTLDPTELVTLIDWPHYQGNVEYFTGKIFGRPEGWEWAVQYYTCRSCKDDMLGIFYHFTQICAGRQFGGLGRPNSSIQCMGCKLDTDLNSERDHFKNTKRSIIHNWLLEEDNEGNTTYHYNTTDLLRALEDFDEKNIGRLVRDLDRLRHGNMRSGPPNERWDRELDERQRPRTKAMMGKLGSKFYAPAVGAWKEWCEQYTLTKEELKWWDFDTRRYCSFG